MLTQSMTLHTHALHIPYYSCNNERHLVKPKCVLDVKEFPDAGKL